MHREQSLSQMKGLDKARKQCTRIRYVYKHNASQKAKEGTRQGFYFPRAIFKYEKWHNDTQDERRDGSPQYK